MRFFIIIIFILFWTTKSYCQCNCDHSDSISIKGIKQNWNSVKSRFVPLDLKKYPLIIEDFTAEQAYSNGKIEYIRYLRKQKGEVVNDTCDLISKNFYAGGWEHIKWIKKYYDGEKKIVNVDSLLYYDTNEYPLVLMFYYEFIWIQGIANSGRSGFYIWDRRNNYKYEIICALGRKDEVWFFKNLNK